MQDKKNMNAYHYTSILCRIAHSEHDAQPEGQAGKIYLKGDFILVPSELVDHVVIEFQSMMPIEKYGIKIEHSPVCGFHKLSIAR